MAEARATDLGPRDARDRLIVALDVPGVDEARAMVETLGDSVSFFKIGFELVFSGGLGLAEELARAGKRVFLDMKLLDIANTVTRAVTAAERLGVTFLTVHAYPQAMTAAVAGRHGGRPGLLGVTVLTSLADGDLLDAGYALGADELVAARARAALHAGMDGLVCSALEVARVRQLVGPGMMLVTPGIRPAGSARGDQKRVTTPRDAVAAGADYLVVGRPIVEASEPRASAEHIVAEIAAASA